MNEQLPDIYLIDPQTELYQHVKALAELNQDEDNFMSGAEFRESMDYLQANCPMTEEFLAQYVVCSDLLDINGTLYFRRTAAAIGEENQGTITAWGNSKFPPRSVKKHFARFMEEVTELAEKVSSLKGMEEIQEIRHYTSNVETIEEVAEVAEEISDLDVFLAQLCSMLGIDRQKSLEAKMSKNRNRTWKQREDGHFQHSEKE